MDKETLIKELVKLGEFNELSNPNISTILYTLAILAREDKEWLLLELVQTADKINDILCNQLINDNES